MTTNPVALVELIRQALKAAGDAGLTLGQLKGLLLDVGVDAEASELSSCMTKLGESVTRSQEERPATGRGRRMVWRYRWKTT